MLKDLKTMHRNVKALSIRLGIQNLSDYGVAEVFKVQAQ